MGGIRKIPRPRFIETIDTQFLDVYNIPGFQVTYLSPNGELSRFLALNQIPLGNNNHNEVRSWESVTLVESLVCVTT